MEQLEQNKDRELLHRILKELQASEDVVSMDNLNIDVVDGVVLIGGMADSFEEREIIEEIIEGTPGVQGVQNSIDI